jgi:glutathione peroxidase
VTAHCRTTSIAAPFLEDFMRTAFTCLVAAVVLGLAVAQAPSGEKRSQIVPPALKFKLTSIDGKTVDLGQYQGKVVLIVNVASECGYTPQYKDLQALYQKHQGDGLVILGIPCNDFGKQEPGTSAQIKEFCTKNYKVTFPLFEKVSIKGEDAHPLYKFLQDKKANPQHGGAVKWNFEKFLLGRDGAVATRFASDVDPASDEFLDVVRKELAKKQ